MIAAAAGHIRFEELGLDPVAYDFGFFTLKWYSLAYIFGIVGGWWYLLKLIDQPGAPMARRHVDDLVFYATLGIILGGRIGYVLFYQPKLLTQPLAALRLWDGGMSFHGGLVGLMLAIAYLCRREDLRLLRVLDYVGCVASIGQFLGRLANFTNGELWGKPSDVPWAIVFPNTVAFGADPARHPSQLYEAIGEGLIPFLIMAWLFWRTDARYKPGFLTGFGLAFFGTARFFIEFFREPDQQFEGTFFANVLHMGQLLCLPMIAIGAYLMWTAKRRRQRVEPIAGTQSIA
ncbi:phosphatidylglycerol:prolipoprotein diacylglycerol transferase [Sphingomonas guangdongensis]|uniref:Phosphatidylglycerol--prolipoprotein diacylglyceryl transferase n=1 Tax=Sphingomonas guangdongensis TaxID=1141890 RepID=A0A285QHQ9_9SPHN|nr:prolipoprotein diacylglyceryl transferase [Sphingomonas guangdongensis]SOB81014.1 phosphatidylglycerol:prolipoprotein diacylglycerol transferase [Sphingomonas guangdongensis]